MKTAMQHHAGDISPALLVQYFLDMRTPLSLLQALFEAMEVDWFAAVTYAADCLILPSMAPRLALLAQAVTLPDEFQVMVEATCVANERRNRTLLADFGVVSKHLTEADVPLMPLKGIAALNEGLYPTLGERMVGDIDIAIPPECIRRALVALRDAGFVQARNRFIVNNTNEPLFSPINVDDFRNTWWYVDSHVPRITHPDMIATIELHLRVTTRQSPLVQWLDNNCFENEQACQTASDYSINDTHHSQPNGPLSTSTLFHLMHNFEHTHLKDKLGAHGIVDWRHLLDTKYRLTTPNSVRLLAEMLAVATTHGVDSELAVHLYQVDTLLGVEGLRIWWDKPEYANAIQRFQRLNSSRLQRLRLLSRQAVRAASAVFTATTLRQRYGSIPLPSAFCKSLLFYSSALKRQK